MSDGLNTLGLRKAPVPTNFAGNGTGRRLTILCAPVMVGFFLSGCALPLPIQIASWAIDGISYIATDKSILDHGISTASKQDCATFRIITDGIVCRATITDEVKNALLAEDSLKSAEINVEEFRGVVQLSGSVSSQADINRVIVITRNIKGVTSVQNDMQLKYADAERDPDFPSISPIAVVPTAKLQTGGLTSNEHWE